MDGRYNSKANEGEVKRSAARGQTIITPIGMDRSDVSGSAAKEVAAKARLGGGMNNLAHSIPGSSGK